MVQGEVTWQPIETAPKDGVVFLGYKKGKFGPLFGECYCTQREDGEVWTFRGSSGFSDIFPDVKPTHWMPLPTPPEG